MKCGRLSGSRQLSSPGGWTSQPPELGAPRELQPVQPGQRAPFPSQQAAGEHEGGVMLRGSESLSASPGPALW